MANRSVTVVSANLFQLALQHLGDATQWNRIAELNGTGPDPVLPLGVVMTLQLPQTNVSQGGGVYRASRLAILQPSYDDSGLTDAQGNTLLGADNATLTGAQPNANSGTADDTLRIVAAVL